MEKRATAVFYSKTSNLILSKKIKNILNELNVDIIYNYDIDKIILKFFSKIDYLILDFSLDVLDERSIDLLIKLREEGYIKEIFSIINADSTSKYFTNIIYDEEFSENIKMLFSKSLSTLKDERLKYEPQWIKIIGDYLVGLGFSPKYCGYILYVDSIIFYLKNNMVVKNLGKSLYPYLSNKHKISTFSVEMRLRTSINKAFCLGGKNFPFSQCPTIKEFVFYSLTQIYSQIYSEKKVVSLN